MSLGKNKDTNESRTMTNIDLSWIPYSILEATDSMRPFQGVGPLTAKFMAGERITTQTREFVYRKNQFNMKLAGVGGLNSQPPVGKTHTESAIAGEVIDFLVQIPINQRDLFFKTGDNTKEANAAAQIEKYMISVFGSLNLAIEWFASQVLQNDGFTLDPSITAFDIGHVSMSNTFNVFGGLQSFTVGADWSTPATDIVAGANQLPEASKLLEDKGFEPGALIYNRNTAKSIAANTSIKSYAVNNGGVTLDWLRSLSAAQVKGIPGLGEETADLYQKIAVQSGIAQIEKWQAWDHYYEDRSNVKQRFIDDDTALLFPAERELEKVLAWVDAPSVIPQGSEYGEQVSDHIELKNGMSVYLARNGGARPTYSLVGVCAGYPVLKNRDGFLKIDTSP